MPAGITAQDAEETLALYYGRPYTKTSGMKIMPLCIRTQWLAMGPNSYSASRRLHTPHTTTQETSRQLTVSTLASPPHGRCVSSPSGQCSTSVFQVLTCSSSPLLAQFALLTSSPLTVPLYARTDIMQQNSSANQQHSGISILKELERTLNGS